MAEETFAGACAALRLWLFPATYLIHVAEEYWGGGGYSAYMLRTRGVELAPTRFLVLNGIGLALMVLGVVLARQLKFSGWLGVCLATLTLANGLSHTIQTLRTSEYNPGLISGLLIWIPLGAFLLLHQRGNMRSRRYWSAFAVGAGIQVCVSLLAISGGKH